MDYSIPTITQRAETSPLWSELSNQEGRTLPSLLERYLLLENWDRRRGWTDPQAGDPQAGGLSSVEDEVSYLHLLLADATTVLLDQQARITKLEEAVKYLQTKGERARMKIR